MLHCGRVFPVLAFLVAMATGATAQQPAASPSPAPSALPQAELLKPEQLEALVAPIALYPDELLANVLAASTYPLEVVEADRWLKQRKPLDQTR